MLELGVAAGKGAAAFLEFLPAEASYIGVDMWAGDGAIQKHDDTEYEAARAEIRATHHTRAALFRETFDEAYIRFLAEGLLFDFVYVDGYAHAGSGGPEALLQWWAMVRPGGIFAVHDYCETWPVQRAAVDDFAAMVWPEVWGVTEEVFPEFPSWWAIHPNTSAASAIRRAR
jgi:predicted O-methyltransferase YrrM